MIGASLVAQCLIDFSSPFHMKSETALNQSAPLRSSTIQSKVMLHYSTCRLMLSIWAKRAVKCEVAVEKIKGQMENWIILHRLGPVVIVLECVCLLNQHFFLFHKLTSFFKALFTVLHKCISYKCYKLLLRNDRKCIYSI